MSFAGGQARDRKTEICLAEKLGMLLKDFDGRISTKDLKDLGMLNTMDMDAARL